jgi:hypothetical protein
MRHMRQPATHHAFNLQADQLVPPVPPLPLPPPPPAATATPTAAATATPAAAAAAPAAELLEEMLPGTA